MICADTVDVCLCQRSQVVRGKQVRDQMKKEQEAAVKIQKVSP